MDEVTLELAHAVRSVGVENAALGARGRASHVAQVAAMFGLGLDDDEPVVVVPRVSLTLRPGAVVFITGPSGGGKSTLLRLIEAALTERNDAAVVRFDRLPVLPDRPLVDALGPAPLARVLRALSLAGLGDAFVMLRRPGELSDGQRYRLRLAQTVLAVEGDEGAGPGPGPGPGARLGAARPTGGLDGVVLADEFGATLDRLTAAVVARNVRRWVRGSRICFIAATTHDDLLEPLEPDVLVHKPLGGAVEVVAKSHGA